MHQPQFHSTNADMHHHELTLVPGMTLTAESLDDFQVSHDATGSYIGGSNTAHNSVTPRLDIQDEVKQNLALSIIATLKKSFDEKVFDRLVIVASPHMLGLLRQHMPTEIAARVVAEISKDLTHEPTGVLLKHIEETLAEARVKGL